MPVLEPDAERRGAVGSEDLDDLGLPVVLADGPAVYKDSIAHGCSHAASLGRHANVATGQDLARWVTAMHTRTPTAASGAAGDRCSPSSSTDQRRVSSGWANWS